MAWHEVSQCLRYHDLTPTLSLLRAGLFACFIDAFGMAFFYSYHRDTGSSLSISSVFTGEVVHVRCMVCASQASVAEREMLDGFGTGWTDDLDAPTVNGLVSREVICRMIEFEI